MLLFLIKPICADALKETEGGLRVMQERTCSEAVSTYMQREKEDQRWARKTAMDFIGEKTFINAGNFFHTINESSYDTVIFISRKAYLMYKVARKAGFAFAPDKTVYSDRILNIPFEYGNPPFSAKKVLLVDDAVTNAHSLAKNHKKLKKDMGKYGIETIDMFVFATNVKSNLQKRLGREFSTHMLMSETDIKAFSSNEARLVHELGMVYSLEFPIYHANFISEKDFNKIEKRMDGLKGQWERKSYTIRLNESLWPKAYNAELIFPLDGAVKTPPVFETLFECVRYNFQKHMVMKQNGRPEKRYSVNFVPIHYYYYLSDAFAKDFLKALCKTEGIDKRENLKVYLDSFGCGDLKSRMECRNKAVTHIISLCLGLEFINLLDLESVKLPVTLIKKDAHMHPDFLDFIEGMKTPGHAVAVRSILNGMMVSGKYALPEGEDLGLEPLSEGLREDLSALLTDGAVRQDVLTDNLKAKLSLDLCKIAADGRSKGIKFNAPKTIFYSVKVYIDKVTDKTNDLHEVVLPMIETSVCSFNTVTKKIGRVHWLFRAYVHGENSAFAVYELLPPKYFNALSRFEFALGGFSKMKEHLDKFQEIIVPLLKNEGEPERDVVATLNGLLSTEEAFNAYYLPEIRHEKKHSIEGVNQQAYSLGRTYA